MRCLLGVAFVAACPWLAISPAAAQATPAEVLENVEQVLVERAAGVRDYSLRARLGSSDLTVYARREAGGWAFDHDAGTDDIAAEFAMMALDLALIAERGMIIDAGQADGARMSLRVDTIRGRIANQLTIKVPPGFVLQRGAEIASVVISFDAETSDVLRVVTTGRSVGSAAEREKLRRMVVAAEMFDYREDGGVRFPRRLRFWGSELLPYVPPAQLELAIDTAASRLAELRRLPPDAETARRITQVELVLVALRTGQMALDVEVADLRINAGPPPGLEVSPPAKP